MEEKYTNTRYLGNIYGLHDGYDGAVFDINYICKTLTRSIGGVADILEIKEIDEQEFLKCQKKN